MARKIRYALAWRLIWLGALIDPTRQASMREIRRAMRFDTPADQEDTERKEWRCAPGEHSWQRFPQISDGIVCAKCGADQEDTDASNDMPGASSLRSRSGDAVNAETTSLDGGGRQPGIERIMGRIVITSALNREVPGLTQSQYDRMADAAMDALINGDCLVPADQEDTDA